MNPQLAELLIIAILLAALLSALYALRKEMRRRLERSEAFTAAIVENALLPLISMDEQGLRRLSQGASPRLIGKRIELFALRADGREFPIALFISLIQHGGARYYTALIADLSEQKRTADELARQREALRKSEKLSTMGALLANVAHELNNPLAILMGRAAPRTSSPARRTRRTPPGSAPPPNAAARSCAPSSAWRASAPPKRRAPTSMKSPRARSACSATACAARTSKCAPPWPPDCRPCTSTPTRSARWCSTSSSTPSSRSKSGAACTSSNWEASGAAPASCCPSPTAARACRSTCASASSKPSSPPRRQASAPDWGSR